MEYLWIFQGGVMGSQGEQVVNGEVVMGSGMRWGNWGWVHANSVSLKA